LICLVCFFFGEAGLFLPPLIPNFGRPWCFGIGSPPTFVGGWISPFPFPEPHSKADFFPSIYGPRFGLANLHPPTPRITPPNTLNTVFTRPLLCLPILHQQPPLGAFSPSTVRFQGPRLFIVSLTPFFQPRPPADALHKKPSLPPDPRKSASSFLFSPNFDATGFHPEVPRC